LPNYRVYEVAEELGVEPDQLIEMLHEMDVRVRSHMSAVDEAHVARLHARFERDRRVASRAKSRSAEDAAAPATTTTRRRRRRVEPLPVAVEAEETPVLDGSSGGDEVPADGAAERIAETEETPAPADAATVIGKSSAEESMAAEAEAPPVEANGVAAVAEAIRSESGEERAEKLSEGNREELNGDLMPEAAASAELPGDDVELLPSEVAPEPEAGEERPESEVAPAPVRPKPVRRGLQTTPVASAAPAAPTEKGGSAGRVRIQAEGYTVDGRRKSRREKKRQRRVDQEVVQENVKKTLASLGGSGGGRRRRRDLHPAEKEAELERQQQEAEAEKTRVRVNEFLTVAELAELMSVSPQQVITSAFKNLGLMVTINQRLDFMQIELICEEFEFEAVREEAYEADLAEFEREESPEDQRPRAPVVTVMGHVDHGKTSLLDYIRKTNVIAGESGGITQHMGAYHVGLEAEKAVTFLDTPGHEAFTAMRARGADMTDVVVLVVAADDAVMPQTVEAISHARNAGVPIVVAINKVDLPTADVARVQQDLLTHGVVLEEFGGDVLSACVSAKTGLNVDELLEKILLQAELLELKANPTGSVSGTVIEAELDRGMGPVATVLVQNGTLQVGDDFLCGLHGGRVRALLDERGNVVEEAGPSTPVRVLGLQGVPQSGDSLVAMDSDRVREISARRQQMEREREIRRRGRGAHLEDLFAAIQSGGTANLNLVIKGDADGSVQALSDSLERLSTREVAVEVIHRGVGAINESDVLLATTSGASILGFHVRPEPKARAVAEREAVEIRTYDVIYEAVEDVRLALEGMLRPEEREVVLGSAEVRQLFRVPKFGTVAGCYVTVGSIGRNMRVRLLRDHVEIYGGRLGSLRRFKEDVREVREGYECGMSIEGYNDIKVGDVIEAYEIEEVARLLADSERAE